MHSYLQNILRRVCMMILLMGLTTVSVLADNTFNQNRTDFRDESIYFMITTRFYDGDPNNNVLCWDNQQAQISTGDPCWRGDFAGVIDRLDYIKALGFTAIWITPIVQNASGYDYHGYHAMDFSKVDVRYESHKGKGKYGGSAQDVTFQSLIDAAHAKGIKIILDIVLNHTGNFGEQKLCHLFDRSQNILNQADINKCMLPDYSKLPSDYLDVENTQYQNRLKWMKNTDGQNHDTKNYWHHVANNWNWDLPNRWWGQIAGDCVDLNTENPEVDDYLIKCYGEFIKMGVDGFRIDTTGHISRLTFNSKFIPEFKALGEQYKSKRLNQAPFYMYGECCARFGGVTYRDQPNLSSYFYTWSSSSSDISKWNSVSAQDWANVVVKEGADPLLNMTACEAEPSDQPTSDNTFMKNGAYHEPDYSRSSGFNVIDFPLHYNFTSAASAYGLACGGDKYYNDASFNVVYVDSHDYGPQPNDGVRFSGSDAQWAENLSLMFTFRGIPCLYYGSEIGFKRGAKIDNGPNGPLSDTGRAYFGGYITGDVTASDFGTYTASGNVAATLNHDLAQHLIRLNKIRQAVPALRKGQWTSDGCQANGGIAFKRAYKDSYALVALNGGATFTGCPSGTYTDLVTGQTYSGSTITVSAPTNQGQVRVLVKDYNGKSGSALLGGDGKFIYASSSASKSGASYDGNQEAGTTSYITKDDATGEAGVYFSQNGGAFTTETLTVTAYLNDCTSGTFSINGGTAKSISSTGTAFTLGQGDEAGTEYTVTWTATTNDGSQKSGSVTFKKVGTYTPSCTADEVCVFYETTASAVGIWVWNDKVNFTGGVWASKPNMEFMGLSASGKNIFKWTYTGSETSAPTGVIFLPGGTQSADLAYTNHGYYIDNVYDHTVESGAATPSFSVDKESQAFNNSISVTITPKNGATVVYTTDGTTPTTRSTTLATNKILNFTETTTLKVALLIDGGVTDVKTYTYTLQEAPTGITIYVKASTAPYLYAWDNSETALNGQWPGTKMTQTTTVSGETYYYQTFSVESVNIIFNNGSGGQTADIKNVTADTYFTYNGTTGYEKVTPDTPERPEPQVSVVNAIKAGNILHCFDWTYNQILSELDNIKAAGFTSIQTSPAQTNYTGSTVWNTLYRPRDTEVGPNTLGTKEDLTALCTAAHQKGLYIIVDVVANHTDGVLTYVADYWKNTDLYHDTDCNYSANDGSRWAVTHGDIGMCDLKTYDERVYSKFKTYIQALKACGVDGIRWDAAKHIGLPSEGDNFWSNALDKEMYNYGEVLNTMGGNSDGTTIPELQGFMSVTDAGYSTNNLLSAFKGGGVPSVAGCWSFQFNNDKWVYWGESHDTFCNNDGASKGVSQNVVDRAYAIAASHNNIPALYFSRPTGGDSNGPSCQAGAKGSTHFTSKEVAEINKFKLTCAGEPDYYSNGNGVCSVTRKSGAVIVKGNGSGNVSVANGGGYLAAGTYTDHVSGGTFTVTSTTISGNVGSSGIAVLYGEGGETGGGGTGGSTGGDTDVTYTVEYTNPNGWTSVDTYIWDPTNDNKLYAGEWPGSGMTGSGSNWTFTFVGPASLKENGMIIFNNGNFGNGNQTDDLYLKDYLKTETIVDNPEDKKENPEDKKEETAIYEIHTSKDSESNNSTLYNLHGIRVTNPVKGGIYIMNGRKIVVK